MHNVYLDFSGVFVISIPPFHTEFLNKLLAFLGVLLLDEVFFDLSLAFGLDLYKQERKTK